VLTLTVLVWPALGALATFGRWRWAIALATLVAATLLAASAQLAAAVFALASVVFALTADAPKRTAKVAAATLLGLVVAAPLLPLVLAPLAQAIPMVGRSTILAMTDWREFVVGDVARLITGHGLDSARYGVVAGYLPPHTPRTILFEVWYDLGLLGALAFATVFAMGFVAAGHAALTVAPALLGGMVATSVIAIFGLATAELWYVTLVSLQAVGLGLLARASRGSRPAVGQLPVEGSSGAERGATNAAPPEHNK